MKGSSLTSSASPVVKPKPTVAPKPPGGGGGGSNGNTMERRQLSAASSQASSASAELPGLPDNMAGIDMKVFTNLKQRYAAKAEAITTQSSAKQAALSKERADINRQQSELQQKLNACRSRMNSTSGQPAMELRRQEAELQNKAGYLDGRQSRITDQMMRNTTELKSAVDRLERERDLEIKKLKEKDASESAM